jgi:hypothetical protein
MEIRVQSPPRGDTFNTNQKRNWTGVRSGQAAQEPGRAANSTNFPQGDAMHELLIGMIFVAMIVLPAILASKPSDESEDEA